MISRTGTPVPVSQNSLSNIQVVVRCRGRNEKEIAAKSAIVTELPNDRYSIIDPYITINQTNQGVSGGSGHEFNNYKTFKVDQVYGSQADQNLMFEKVVTPLFNDFLMGFNVTVLAYGQTGTGKTYTMCGNPEELSQDYDELEDGGVEFNENVGIIPRVLVELFRKLNGDDDYVVKCSFLELYNEDLKDLLDDEYEENSKNIKKRLRIFEVNNNNNNNKKSILIQNLTEEYINSFNQGFRLLKKGLKKRKTAFTKLNDFSSRSHTIFTINLFRKQPNSSELFRISKMNLVDLAGSENINKSGAINQRAKEAGSINQSLLTLGRVINSLSELNSTTNTSTKKDLSHIPYRESKLTRLLQDSIGGSTKTTLIATISPAKINIEETLSTLDYASKAKNIKNVPINGQDCESIMKRILVKNLSNELIKMGLDLSSTRSKNGIYLNEENYQEIIETSNSLKSSLKEVNDENTLLKLKLKKFESINVTNQKSIRTLNQEIEELKRLNEDLHHTNNKLNTSLDDKDNKLKDLSYTFNQFTEILNENLSLSFSTIEPLLTSFNEANDKVDDSNNLLKSFQNFKFELVDRLNTIKLNLNEFSSTNLPSILIEFKQLFKKLHQTFETHYHSFEENVKKMKLNNEKLLNYIANTEINNDKLEQLIKEKVAGQLKKMYSDFNTNLNQLVEEHQKSSLLFVNDSIKSINHDIVTDYQSKLITTSQDWNKVNVKYTTNIEKDIQAMNSQLNEPPIIEDSKVKDIIHLQDRNINDLKHVMKMLNDEDTSNHKKISKQIIDINKFNSSLLLQNDNLKNGIIDINKSLRVISNTVEPTATHISPSRKSVSPTRRLSPAKENLKISSKIPKLTNSEMFPPSKKRKVLHQTDRANM
ncbi:P-loop containing nucleoside triphosphate hydrolase protein [Scheffersomyces amazonensis]|uniref:P-loop containing nucleoside triphosphate hydrolase protein n=1 Tax=Scheffersomyces amazonensis TaxID=1078765 RepID=UPI00315C79A4